MARPHEYASGGASPVTGVYEQINLFGHAVGRRVTVLQGELFPEAPRGNTWTLVGQENPVVEGVNPVI